MSKSCFLLLVFVNLDAIIDNLFAANFLHNVAQAFDFRHKGLDVGLRNFEIEIVARFNVGALQQVEQAFFLGRVARGTPGTIRSSMPCSFGATSPDRDSSSYTEYASTIPCAISFQQIGVIGKTLSYTILSRFQILRFQENGWPTKTCRQNISVPVP